MKSLAQVANLPVETPTSYEDLETKGVCVEFEVQRFKPGTMCKPKPSSKDDDSLRRRKGEEGIEEVVTEEVTREVKDPIRWFGVLVPQTLRRSQQCFVQGNHCLIVISPSN
jgi:hypothetical protein